jgi:hypothetical protein
MKMNSFFKKQRNILAGFLAAAILAFSLTGCGGSVQNQIQSVLNDLNSVSSQAQSAFSQAQASLHNGVSSGSGTKSSVASIKTASSKSVSASVQSSAGVKQPADSGAQVGNQSVQKIAIDRTAETAARAAVSPGRVTGDKYTKINQRSGYSFLSDSVSRSLYNSMLKSAYEIAVKPAASGYYPIKAITLTGTRLTEAQLRIVLMAFLNDNPQVFWVANVFSYQYAGNSMTIQLYSTVSQSRCASMIQALNQKLSAVMGNMPGGLTELDRELYLSEYLVNHCTYDTAAVTDSTRWKAFNAYGALVEGSVVCEGYSRAMQLLSAYTGLSCSLVTGTGNGGSHMWNLIKIGGSWYHLDLTWDDNSPEIYNYFNVTDSVIRQTHTVFPGASSFSAAQITGTSGVPSGFNLFLPACTATAANYYKAKGIHIATLAGASDAAAISAVTEAAKQKKASVSFYIEPDADYDKTIGGMISTAPQKLFYYLAQANKQLPSGSRIVTNSIQYMQDGANRGLTVFLTYR